MISDIEVSALEVGKAIGIEIRTLTVTNAGALSARNIVVVKIMEVSMIWLLHDFKGDLSAAESICRVSQDFEDNYVNECSARYRFQKFRSVD